MAGLHKAIAQLMEGRSERPKERADTPALHLLLQVVRERIAPAERALGETFARELIDRTPGILGDDADPAALGALASSAFAFLRDRSAAPIAVRVFTPDRARDGWSTPLTVIECTLDDRPFIVDTITETIEAAGGDIRLLMHPLLGVDRAADGSILHLGGPEMAATRESFVHAHVAKLPPSPDLQRLLAAHLDQLVRVTDDYRAMRERTAALAAALRAQVLPAPWNDEREELAAFLDWLGARSFVYLGYREYDLRGTTPREASVRRGSGLGLLRDERRSRYHTPQPLPAELARHLDRPPLWLVATTRAVSPVHRAAPMDDIVIKAVDAHGAVVRIHRLIGLFTAKAYADAASDIPLLRRRLAQVLEREAVLPDSHDHRELVGLFNTVPRDHLLGSPAAALQELLDAIRHADPRGGIDVVCQPAALGRGLFVTVLVPRRRFSTELHGSITAHVRQALQADVVAEHLALDDRPVARLHYACAVPDELRAHPPAGPLRAALNTLLRTWDDELLDALAETRARGDAERLVARYARALPPEYKASRHPAAAARDLHALETLAHGDRAQIELYPPDAPGTAHALTLYLTGESLVLSDFVPVLENLGLRVLGQDVVSLRLGDGAGTAIHTFTVESGVRGADLAPAAHALVQALQAVRAGWTENDPLQRLVLGASLDWRAVALLRALVEHAQQVGVGTRPTVIEALTANPAVATQLFRYFAAKFDPGASPLAPAERLTGPVAAVERELADVLRDVPSLAHDRILRALAQTIAATVRTNFYVAPPGGAIALKLDAAQLAHLPLPRPLVELWVHAPAMNGVHLRAARIARGGIRASDRLDDFRAEVLGLMRTQVVKNALIVPGGAKGGFIVKRMAGASGEDAVAAAYRQFIGALLSVTDTIANGRPVSPGGVLVYDEPDPYLVVAADKGTAGLSDLANQLATERGFWLGDAFASGGAHGYDHKRLGITARGAWECAREHFRNLGRVLDDEVVTVAGIGDMSGDVFGNGMLRSRRLRLLAAFNHRDIFIDPDPDPELSYRERERLFHLPRSGWTDYSPSSLSRGGGVYARAAKVIPLSPAARALLEITDETASGEAVIRAILRLPVDLLWNGGIGTYVKASDEQHVDVADPANDAVRIDARELRAAVVAEGGNLGLTPRARVEYALAGGHINTDAIDNSAGVDLSDHEVNLKIALQPVIASGELLTEARDTLLAHVADAVCQAVLHHNHRQARALTLEQVRSRTQLASFRDLMVVLETEEGLDRHLTALPTRESLRARRALFVGLTRPELAVLLAHAKLDLRRRLEHATLIDEPELAVQLHAYFPAEIRDRFALRLDRHPLRRQIVALGIAHALVDTMGMTFLVRTVRDTGRDVLDVVRTWVVAEALTAAPALGRDIEAAGLPPHAEDRALFALAAGLERATCWLVRHLAPGRPLAESLERVRPPLEALTRDWRAALPGARRAAHDAAIEELTAGGVPASLAERLIQLGDLDEALEITRIAEIAGVPLAAAAEAYFAAIGLVDLEWVRRTLPSTLPGEDRWEPRAVAGLLEVVQEMRRVLTLDLLELRRADDAIVGALEHFAATHRAQVDMVAELIGDQKTAAQPTLAAMLVIIREIGRLVRPLDGPRPW